MMSRGMPSWEIGIPPETLEFHCPGLEGPIALQDDIPLLYRQLVSWCLVQCYRYWVLSDPAVPDTEYDMVEHYVRHLEEELGGDLEPAIRHYSPTHRIYGVSTAQYPIWVQGFFAGKPIRPHQAESQGIDRYKVAQEAARRRAFRSANPVQYVFDASSKNP